MSFDLNRVQLIGRITSDPESRSTASGKTVVNLFVATNRKISSSGLEMTEFHKASAWSRLGEICQEYLHKGDKVFLEGRIHNSSWESKTGGKNYRSEIVIEKLIMLENKSRHLSEEDLDQLTEDDLEIESAEIISE